MSGLPARPRPQKVISPTEAVAVIASGVIGVGVLALPRIAVGVAATGAPLATALAALLSWTGLLGILGLGRRFPDLTLFQCAEVITGRVAGRALSLLFAVFFALFTALAAREFGEVVVTVVLPRTPLEITTVILLILAATAARNNLGTFGRIQLFYLPFIIFPGLIIVLLSLKNARAVYLLPPWGTGPAALLKGAVLVATLFQVAAVWGVVQPFQKHPNRAVTATTEGLALAAFVYVLAVVGALAVFGPRETGGLLWPTLELAKTTAVAGGVIERLDAPFLIVWVAAVFTSVYATYLVAAVGLMQTLGLRSHKSLVFPLFPLVYFLALRPHDIQTLYQTITVVGLAGLPLTIAWPLVLLAVAALRGLRTGDAA